MWANKKCKNFNMYNVFKKNKERKTPSNIIILDPCTKNLDIPYRKNYIVNFRVPVNFLKMFPHFLMYI